MKRRPWAILLLTPLWACASQPASNPPNASAPAAAPPPATASDDSPSVLSLLATPFYIAFKIPGCAGSVLVAPGALASAVVPFKDKNPGSGADLMAGEMKDACGPPYIANAH